MVAICSPSPKWLKLPARKVGDRSRFDIQVPKIQEVSSLVSVSVG